MRAYRLTAGPSAGLVATYAGPHYVGGHGHLDFFDAPDGRTYSERRIGAMLAAGEAEEAVADCPAGHALHVDLGRAGTGDHYAFASRVLGRPVAHFRFLTPGEREAVRAAALGPHPAGVAADADWRAAHAPERRHAAFRAARAAGHIPA